jgi:hypothetical protein
MWGDTIVPANSHAFEETAVVVWENGNEPTIVKKSW